MLIVIVYLIPWVIVLLFAAPKFIELRRILKNTDSEEEKAEILNDLKRKFEKSSKLNASISDLKKLNQLSFLNCGSY